MIDLSPFTIIVIMFGGVAIGIVLGVPVALVMGIVAFGVGYAVFGNNLGTLLYTRLWDLLSNYILLAVPLFIFMGNMLEGSGIAGKLYDAMYEFLGGIPGGLAVVTILIGTVLAACVGIIAASITMLTLVALDPMMKRGYDKGLATGAIMAGGCLGILIPPSIMLVMYGPMAQISVGKLFFGAFGPGLLLSILYMVYIIIATRINPSFAPATPVDAERLPFNKKVNLLLSALLPPLILVFAVLGVIFFGIAPPTEAAGVGAFAAIILVIAYRKFNLKMLRKVVFDTFATCGMIFILSSMCFFFVGVFLGSGCGDFIAKVMSTVPGGRWGSFALIMLIIFALGFIIDWLGIVFIMVPILSRIVPSLGFDQTWFAIMVCVNLQTSFLTPPFAWAIFNLKAILPPQAGVTMNDLVRGVVPFVALILVALGLCIAFPDIILWLPTKMIR